MLLHDRSAAFYDTWSSWDLYEMKQRLGLRNELEGE